MNLTKEEALAKIEELKQYIKEYEDNKYDPSKLKIEGEKILYGEDTIVGMYYEEQMQEDDELIYLKEYNLPKGYKFAICKGNTGATVLKLVRK